MKPGQYIVGIAALAMLLLAPVARAYALPTIEIVSGYGVNLRADLVRDGDTASVRGWARRTPGHFARIYAHLHIEPIDAAGQSVGVIETRWTGALNIRDRAAARVDAAIDPDLLEGAVKLRISVVPGVDHH